MQPIDETDISDKTALEPKPPENAQIDSGAAPEDIVTEPVQKIEFKTGQRIIFEGIPFTITCITRKSVTLTLPPGVHFNVTNTGLPKKGQKDHKRGRKI